MNESLAGAYAWSVPGSVWTLTLSVSGHYSLTTRGGLEKSERPIESGTWRFEGVAIVLDSTQPPISGGEYRRLHALQKKSGQMMLVSAVRSESYIGQPLSGDTLFDYVFLRVDAVSQKEANQTPDRTPPSGVGHH